MALYSKTTTFVIPNLHCNSCVLQIERVLYGLQPRPFNISHSIIAHTVNVTHPSDLSTDAVAQALDDAGFDVYDDSRLSRRVSGAFEKAVQSWRSGSRDVDSRKRKRHMEHCEECQNRFEIDDDQDEALRSSKYFISGMDNDDFEKQDLPELQQVVAIDPSLTNQRFEALVAIQGMTCSSCTGSVTEALEKEPFVLSANVSLLTHSATVVIDDETKEDKIVEIIEDIGFEASLQRATPQAAPALAISPAARWRAEYAITGLTCSSCVASVTQALEAQHFTLQVDVNLLKNTATVLLASPNDTERVVELIEDIGFEAKLEALKEMQQTQVLQEQSQRRQLAIEVKGMYCEHCPPKVVSAIQDLSSGIIIDHPPSMANPVVIISYTPHAPQLSVRTVLGIIEQKDTAFEPSIHTPPSLEERSQQIYHREQRHIWFRVIVCILSAIPTFIIGIVYMNLLATNDAGRKYLMTKASGVQRGTWTMLVLATPVYFFCADMFHKRMLREIRALWRPGSPVPLLRRFYRFGSMNMLISLGTSIAYWASLAQVIVTAKNRSKANDDGQSETYFDSVVFLTLFLLIGRLIEAHSKAKTGDAVSALGQMRPSTALLLDQGDRHSAKISQVDANLIDVGDIIRILPGSSPPCDGILSNGSTRFDESSLTGESKLIPKRVGDVVFGGTVNKDSAVDVRITSPTGQSMLDEVVAAIREGQTKRAPIERTADMLTSYFVPVITALAIITWIIWMSLGVSGSLPTDYLDADAGGWPFWSLQFAIAVFVVACPCGLGLAAPTALFVGGGIAAQHGILVKGGGEAFQEASAIDVVAFDKTGTLTQGGAPKVVEAFVKHEDKNLILTMVAKLEQDSTHPVAKALSEYCLVHPDRKIEILSSEEVSGKGLRGTLQAERASEADKTSIEIAVGSETLMDDSGVVLSAEQQQRIEGWKRAGYSIALAAMKSSDSTSFILVGSFAAADSLRPESKHVVSSLRDAGISVWMLSGDNQTTAEAIAAQVGIPASNVLAGVLPSQKSEKIKYLQQSQPQCSQRSSLNIFRNSPSPSSTRAKVAMVGDGINDAPALAAADVGIALASGTDVAVQTAPFVILNPSSLEALNLRTVLTLFALSKKVFRRVRFNFAWAFMYNLVLVPLAAGVLYPVRESGGSHVRLDPAWAALAMACSSVSVVVSSLALRWTWLPGVGFKPSGDDGMRDMDNQIVEVAKQADRGVLSVPNVSQQDARPSCCKDKMAVSEMVNKPAPSYESSGGRWDTREGLRGGRFVHDD